jgi:hypothetical protein
VAKTPHNPPKKDRPPICLVADDSGSVESRLRRRLPEIRERMLHLVAALAARSLEAANDDRE